LDETGDDTGHGFRYEKGVKKEDEGDVKGGTLFSLCYPPARQNSPPFMDNLPCSRDRSRPDCIPGPTIAHFLLPTALPKIGDAL
jgi:hypothetical protein